MKTITYKLKSFQKNLVIFEYNDIFFGIKDDNLYQEEKYSDDALEPIEFFKNSIEFDSAKKLDTNNLQNSEDDRKILQIYNSLRLALKNGELKIEN